MWTDEFTLYDEEGKEVLSRKIVEHIHLAIIEQGLVKGQWIFLSKETLIPAIWKPVFRMPETVLILLG